MAIRPDSRGFSLYMLSKCTLNGQAEGAMNWAWGHTQGFPQHCLGLSGKANSFSYHLLASCLCKAPLSPPPPLPIGHLEDIFVPCSLALSSHPHNILHCKSLQKRHLLTHCSYTPPSLSVPIDLIKGLSVADVCVNTILISGGFISGGWVFSTSF